MRITMPELDIKLYEEGFEDHDKLGRAQLGKKLSELVEKIEEPLVIALNSSWGNGKTHFLKCWVGAHKLENNGKATTIYFDAFKNDYLDDPLISLTDAIIQRKGADKKSSKAIESLKKSAPKLARTAVRVIAAVATAGASEIVGNVADAALSSANSEFDKTTEEFWKKEDGKRAAMAGFEQALIDLTKNEGDEDQKIVIVIDELDRCRPDFALSMLETIKHFFQIPNVHFILGVNLDELKNSVRARYGSGVNADVYLQKFINANMKMPSSAGVQGASKAYLEYYIFVCDSLNVSNSLTKHCYELLEDIKKNGNISLRAIEQLVGKLAIAPSVLENQKFGYSTLFITVEMLEYLSPKLYYKFQNKTLELGEVVSFFNFDNETDRGTAHIITWAILLGVQNEEIDEKFKNIFDSFGDIPKQEKLYGIIERYQNTFDLNER